MNRRFYLLAVIIGVICATGFFYAEQQEHYLAPANPAPPIVTENLFPHPDLTTYKMELYLDINDRTLYGTTAINTVNTTGKTLKELWFTAYPNAFKDAKLTPAPSGAYYSGFSEGWLKIDSLRVNEENASYQEEGIAGQAVLSHSLLPQDELNIEISWRVKIPKLAYRFGFKNGIYMLGNFYPALNVYDEQGWHNSYNSKFGDPFCLPAADYQVNISLPEAYNMVSNGDITDVWAEDIGRTIYQVNANKVREFTLVVTYAYQEINQKIKGHHIKCCFPSNNNDIALQIVEDSGKILAYYATLIGSYSYPDFKIVFVPMKGFQGMEYSGLIFLRQELLNPNYDEKERQFLLAHEIAHQWCYAMIGNDQLREPWLDEGLANWLAYKYLEKYRGQNLPNVNNFKDGINLGKQLSEMRSTQDYYRTAYDGGAAFWLGLEKELGEETVVNILRTYLAQYKFRIATRQDLFSIINQEAPRNMDYYFSKWFK